MDEVEGNIIMTEAQEAHYKESQIPLEDFVSSMDYEGLTSAQRKFGNEGLDFVYSKRVAPTPRDAEHYDTQDRNGRLRFFASFNPEDSDWYPEISEPIVTDTAIKVQSVGKATLYLVKEAA